MPQDASVNEPPSVTVTTKVGLYQAIKQLKDNDRNLISLIINRDTFACTNICQMYADIKALIESLSTNTYLRILKIDDNILTFDMQKGIVNSFIKHKILNNLTISFSPLVPIYAFMPSHRKYPIDAPNQFIKDCISFNVARDQRIQAFSSFLSGNKPIVSKENIKNPEQQCLHANKRRKIMREDSLQIQDLPEAILIYITEFIIYKPKQLHLSESVSTAPRPKPS